MRAAFVSVLQSLAEQDDRVMLLTGDLGFMVVESFAAAHPNRFINVGVAEANMIGVATGLAAQGFIPFCYSIATFASMRGYEQLRNGPVLHRSKVRVVGIGGGYSYGSAGITHHALEDIGLARLQPGLGVIAPADDEQAGAALRATYDIAGPIYYRIGKDRTVIPALQGRFGSGRLETIGDGHEVLLLTYGSMSASVVDAADRLRRLGIDAAVGIVASLSPAPLDDLAARIERTRLVVTVEDHYLTGGLGTLVAEVLADRRLRAPLARMGVSASLPGRTGSETYMRREVGLSVENIVEQVHRRLAASS